MSSQDIAEESTLFFQSEKRQPIYVAIVGGVSLFIAISLLIVSCVLYGYTGGEIPFDNGIVIDAGSSHTEIFLYKWLGSKDHGTGDVFQNDSCTSEGGIDSVPDFTTIVNCVNNVTQKIPTAVRSSTPLYLGATAGMRLLNLTASKLTRMILMALKYALKETSTDVKSVGIIEGYDEGMYAWISVNFLMKTLNTEKYSWLFSKSLEPWKNTLGALDMGGASTQIAFAVDPNYAKNTTPITDVKLYGHSYKVLSKSFLCFGMMQAFYRHQALLVKDLNSTSHIIDPCLPKGNFSKSNAESLLGGPCTETPEFENWLEHHGSQELTFEGGSDFNGCEENVDNLLNTTMCVNKGFKMCPDSFKMSNISADFMAFSSYYYMTHFLNSTNVSLTELISNTEDWCKLSWDEIKHHKFNKADLSHVTQYCFGAIYMRKWLTNIYGFDETSWSNLKFQQQIDGSDVGWTLGYMIDTSNVIPEESATPAVLSTLVFIIMILASIPMAVIGIIFIHKFCKTRYKYSQLRHRRLIES